MVKGLEVKRIPRSFGYATRGIWHVIRTEQNLRIHALAAAIVIVAGIVFGITAVEFAIILLATGLVIVTEVLNTIVEDFLDILHPTQHPTIRRIKDALAGAVLVTAIVAVGVGALIFLPYLFAAID